MQKWEYLTLRCDDDVLENGTVIGKYTANRHGAFINKAPIHEYLNSLGDQGWELVNAINLLLYVFKRPKV